MSEVLFEQVELPAGGQNISTAALHAWLLQLAQVDMDVLLAHCEDGIVWGRVIGSGLATQEGEGAHLWQAADFFAETPLRLEAATLQQARLFGPGGELLIWRAAGGLKARLIWRAAQTSHPLAEWLSPPLVLADALEDERYLLWGDHVLHTSIPSGFVLLAEGRQGLRHAPPLPGLAQGARAALVVRHYIQFDAGGRARIGLSRLAGLAVHKLERQAA